MNARVPPGTALGTCEKGEVGSVEGDAERESEGDDAEEADASLPTNGGRDGLAGGNLYSAGECVSGACVT